MKKSILLILSLLFLDSCMSDRFFNFDVLSDFRPAGNSIAIISQSNEKLDAAIRECVAGSFDNYSTLRTKIKAQGKVDPPFTVTYTKVNEDLEKVDRAGIQSLSDRYRTDYIFVFWQSPTVIQNYYKFQGAEKIHFSNELRVYYQLFGNPGNVLISSGFFVITWYEKLENVETVGGDTLGDAGNPKMKTPYTAEEGVSGGVKSFVQYLCRKMDISRPE